MQQRGARGQRRELALAGKTDRKPPQGQRPAEKSLPVSRLRISPERLRSGSWAGPVPPRRVPLPPAPLNTDTSAPSDKDPSSRCEAGWLWLRALIGEALEGEGRRRGEGGAGSGRERGWDAGFVSFRQASALFLNQSPCWGFPGRSVGWRANPRSREVIGV